MGVAAMAGGHAGKTFLLRWKSSCSMKTNATSRIFPGWQVGWTASPDKAPERFVPAVVPGAVQLDWARAEGWPPYWQDDNFLAYGWMEDVHWVYRTRIEKPALKSGHRLVLVCGGVDYACTVRVEGRDVHSQEGMFSPFEVDLTDTADGGLVEIIVAPAPKIPVPAEEVSDRERKESRESCKPAVSYVRRISATFSHKISDDPLRLRWGPSSTNKKILIGSGHHAFAARSCLTCSGE